MWVALAGTVGSDTLDWYYLLEVENMIMENTRVLKEMVSFFILMVKENLCEFFIDIICINLSLASAFLPHCE